MKKLIITGGHLTPALAVMSKLGPEWQVIYIGRKHALEGDRALSQEYVTISKLGIRFKPLVTGRLQRNFSWQSIASLSKLPVGFIWAFIYLISIRPKKVMSFGGYVAVPVVISAWLLGIEVITHEQTFVPGLANKIIGSCATTICLGWEDLKSNFPKEKIIVTGNPLRPELFLPGKPLITHIKKPLLYITGGSLGSHVINQVVAESLEKLLKSFTVVHQTGNSLQYRDYHHLLELKTRLPKMLQNDYLPLEYVAPENIGWLMSRCEVVVGRAGANTITELIAFTKPAILIPLPWSGGNEQVANASYLVDCGGAVLLPQDKLIPESFLTSVLLAYKSRKNVTDALVKLKNKLPLDAAEKIVEVIES